SVLVFYTIHVFLYPHWLFTFGLRKERHIICGEVSVETVLKKFTLVILVISLFGILLCLSKIGIHIVISVHFKMLIPYQHYIEINSATVSLTSIVIAASLLTVIIAFRRRENIYFVGDQPSPIVVEPPLLQDGYQRQTYTDL
ncbi:developmentally-regulated external PM-anchored protein, partial [Acrasis kona]